MDNGDERIPSWRACRLCARKMGWWHSLFHSLCPRCLLRFRIG